MACSLGFGTWMQTASTPTQSPNQFLHLLGMCFGIDLLHEFCDATTGIYQECGSNESHVGFSIELFLPPNAQFFSGFVLGIG